MRNVINEYYGLNQIYPEVEFEIWGFTFSTTSWVVKFLTKPKYNDKVRLHQEWELRIYEENSHLLNEGLGSQVGKSHKNIHVKNKK
jgi:hypothetical protein